MWKVCRLETTALKLATVSFQVTCYLVYRFWENGSLGSTWGVVVVHVRGLAPMVMLYV